MQFLFFVQLMSGRADLCVFAAECQAEASARPSRSAAQKELPFKRVSCGLVLPRFRQETFQRRPFSWLRSVLSMMERCEVFVLSERRESRDSSTALYHGGANQRYSVVHDVAPFSFRGLPEDGQRDGHKQGGTFETPGHATSEDEYATRQVTACDGTERGDTARWSQKQTPR